MDDNCRPLEHFNYFFFYFCYFLQDGQQAENMHKTEPTKCSSSPGPIPSVLLLLLLLSQLLCRVKGKGSENIRKNAVTQFPGFDIQSKGGHTTDCTIWGIAHSHIFVLFVVLWYIIFCLYKTGPRKTTQHITSFLFVLFFLPKPGEKKLHFCTIACYKMLQVLSDFLIL